MPLTRTFIAIDFPDEVIEEIARIQEIISKKNFTGKTTELKNMHLTLKFLGEIDDSMIDKIKEKLSAIKFNSLDLKLGETGTFAKNGNPRIVWIKIEAKDLWELQSKIDSVMHELGFPKEERFTPHTTLARIKYVKDKKEFREYIKSIKPKKISFQVNEFHLKKSDLEDFGPTYTDLGHYKSQSL